MLRTRDASPATAELDESVDIDHPGLAGPKPVEEPETWGWRREHRIGLAILTFILVGVLTFALLRRPARLGDSLVIVNGERAELPATMDPNTADAAALSRIPGVGEKSAGMIVAYREVHRYEFPDGLVFRKLDDLASAGKIRSKKALEMCRIYLSFPDEPNPSPHGLTPPRPMPEAAGADGLDD